MPSTEVYILGQKYTIKGDSPEEHIKSLAAEIDRRIAEVFASYPNISSSNALILTLFNLTDELRRMRNDQEHVTANLSRKADQLSRLFE